MTSRSNLTPHRLGGLLAAIALLAAPTLAHADEPAPVTLDAACKHAAALAASEPSLGPDDARAVGDSCKTAFAPGACADSQGAAACIVAATGLGELDGCAAQFCSPADDSPILEDESTLAMAFTACTRFEAVGAPLTGGADTIDACAANLIDKLGTEQCIDPIGALICLGEVDSSEAVDTCLAVCQLPAGE